MAHVPVRIILTRPEAANTLLLARLQDFLPDHTVFVEAPLLRIVPSGVQLDDHAIETVIFTSRNGILHAPQGRGRRAFCVGEATGALALDAGWKPTVAGINADTLFDHLAGLNLTQPIVHLAGRQTRGQIIERLQAIGVPATRVVVYEQQPLELSQEARQILADDHPVIVPLFSPETARIFSDQNLDLSHVYVAALSPAVAEQVGNLRVFKILVADKPELSAMVDTIAHLMNHASLG